MTKTNDKFIFFKLLLLLLLISISSYYIYANKDIIFKFLEKIYNPDVIEDEYEVSSLSGALHNQASARRSSAQELSAKTNNLKVIEDRKLELLDYQHDIKNLYNLIDKIKFGENYSNEITPLMHMSKNDVLKEAFQILGANSGGKYFNLKQNKELIQALKKRIFMHENLQITNASPSNWQSDLKRYLSYFVIYINYNEVNNTETEKQIIYIEQLFDSRQYNILQNELNKYQYLINNNAFFKLNNNLDRMLVLLEAAEKIEKFIFENLKLELIKQGNIN